VYLAIRDAIRERALVPGERLVERDLAERFGVSRTPVREALRLLEANGLASTSPGAGLVVRSLSPSEISDLYFAWEEMEAIAARRAATVASDYEIAMLKSIQQKWDPEADHKTLSDLNKQFHLALRSAASNVFLLRALSSVHDVVSLLGISTYSVPNRAAEIGREHEAIISAIAERDPERAELAARTHIRRNAATRMEMLALGEPALRRPGRKLLVD
jgi:DNA-binding GntR family transcriptional regulator